MGQRPRLIVNKCGAFVPDWFVHSSDSDHCALLRTRLCALLGMLRCRKNRRMANAKECTDDDHDSSDP